MLTEVGWEEIAVTSNQVNRGQPKTTAGKNENLLMSREMPHSEIDQELDEIVKPFIQKLKVNISNKSTLEEGIKWLPFYLKVSKSAMSKVNIKVMELEKSGKMTHDEGLTLLKRYQDQFVSLGPKK